MQARHRRRLLALPVYLLGVSAVSTFALVYLRSPSSWAGTLVDLWLSLGGVLLAVGGSATGWKAATLRRQGRLGRAVVVAAVGTVATLYASALVSQSILYPDMSFYEAFAIGYGTWLVWVLTFGAPGIMVGIVAPILWGRWESHHEAAETAT